MLTNPPVESPLPIHRIFKTWWPLAASWLLMGAELPALSAVVARLANPEINLAAYSGIVFPLALLVESPIIMLLAASTALSKDWETYRKLRRFMLVTGGALTALHVLVAFTPLYYLVVEGLMGAQPDIVEPGRLGLRLLTPWTFSIAYRRFNQGVLIRFGHSQTVGVGTVVRLGADLLVLGVGYWLGNVPGIAVAAGAVACGVMSEALYVGWVVRPVLAYELRPAPAVKDPLTLGGFLRFYIPLAMTSLLTLLSQPIGSAALNRMPQAVESLAVWLVVSSFVFLFRSLGMAFNEVVVALLDEPMSSRSLLRFTNWLAFITSLGLFLMAATPFSQRWFVQVIGLKPELAELGGQALWLAIPVPALAVLQSWYQGAILHGRRTRGITEAVVIYLLVIGILLWAGVIWGRATGVFVALAAMTISMAVQSVWLRWRSRPVWASVRERDSQVATQPMTEAMFD